MYLEHTHYSFVLALLLLLLPFLHFVLSFTLSIFDAPSSVV
jgi:hypothetical protein